MSSTVFQEDIPQPASWPSERRPITNTQLSKGKRKERQVHTENRDPSSSQTSSEVLDAISYPPISDDAEETRRVEEASLASGKLAAL